MNPAEETNLLAEVAVMREMIKLLVAQLPNTAATTAALGELGTRIVESAPPYTQQRVALQRALKLLDLEVARKPAAG